MKALPGKLYCIAGADTDAGKTVITAALLRALHGLGISAQAIKAVQSGRLLLPDGALAASDPEIYRQAAPNAPSRALVCLHAACSPHLAAVLEKKRPPQAACLAAHIRREAKKAEISLIEGSGGLFVPLNRKEHLLDLFALLQAPVLLAATNRLGAINHTLLSLEALHVRHIPVPAVILTRAAPVPEDGFEARLLRDNAAAVARMGKINVLSLPWQAGLREGSAEAWDGLALRLRPLARSLAAQCSNGTRLEPR